ncbi:MAG: hypothetical protein ACYC4Q_06720 [Victivallaceae bacterium]
MKQKEGDGAAISSIPEECGFFMQGASRQSEKLNAALAETMRQAGCRTIKLQVQEKEKIKQGDWHNEKVQVLERSF